MEFQSNKPVLLGSFFFLILLLIINQVDLIYNSNSTESPAAAPYKKSVKTDFKHDTSLRFVRNMGQAGTEAKFHVQAAGHTVLFSEEEIVLRRKDFSQKQNEITLKFKNANLKPRIEPGVALPGVAHFFKGSDPEKWQTNVSTYHSVIYRNLYTGIDMAYLGNDGMLESEFYVSGGTNYKQIRLDYAGIKSKKIREDGALLIETELGELVEKAPIAFQEMGGIRKEVEVNYVIEEGEAIGFQLGEYNPDYPVVIDPELIFIKTFGNGTDAAWANSVVIDKVGNLLVAGAADRFFPATDTIAGSNHTDGMSNDGLLLKLDGTTGDVIYSALFGGTSLDYFTDLAVDTAGTVFLTGLTSSDDFPLLNPSQLNYGGSTDGFLCILNSNGELAQSSYLGGSQKDWGEGIAIDDSSNIYIGGRTASADFPILGGFQQQHHGGASGSPFPSDIFATKFDTIGIIKYSSFLGGSEDDKFESIAVTGDGLATITGHTKSTDYPLMNAFQSNLAGGNTDIIYSRINADGTGLLYSSYYGGMGFDQGFDIRLAEGGEAFICGGSTSQDFPIIGGQSFPEQDISDGVLVKVDNAGQPVYSVRSNIAGSDFFEALAVDDSLTVYPVSTYLDTIRIFQKTEDDSLQILYDVPENGHRVSAIDYSEGYLAFAGRYFGTFRSEHKKSLKSNHGFITESEVSAGLVRVLNLFQSSITEDSVLCIIINFPNEDGLIVDVNPNGFITLNGETTLLEANAVGDIKIDGSEGNDCIDLREVTRQKFSNFPYLRYIDVYALEGNDKVFGSLDINNRLRGGDGNDELHGGNESDRLFGNNGDDMIWGGFRGDYVEGNSGDDILFGECGYDILNGGSGSDQMYGGDGNDYLVSDDKGDVADGGLDYDTFLIEKKPGRSGQLINEPLQAYRLAPTIISDDSGLDTLNFTQTASAITLDINIINSEQTIDTSGFQIILEGQFEVILSSDFDDEITVSPLPDTLVHLDGRDGIDILNYKVESNESTDNGSIISTPGYADVSYINFETVNIVDNSPPIGIEVSSPLRAIALPNGQVELKWSSASEINNKGFEIHRSIDGVDFKSIDFVPGKGNSFSDADYSVLDRQPLEENYYRYKQIDFDGAFSFSEVVYLRLENDRRDHFLIYPNPNSGDKIHIEFNLEKNENVSIHIYSISGNIITSKETGFLPKGKHHFEFNPSDFEHGIYILQISTEARTYCKKILFN